jgi:2,3-bisphosphoglycerate-independent phosphoglycerate mutase
MALTQGEGNKSANAVEAVQTAYSSGITDEFIKPTVIVNGGVPVGTVNDDDAAVFFNFRPDRARELTRAFCEDEFRMFKRERLPGLKFVCFTDPEPSLENKTVVFKQQTPENCLGEYLSGCGLSQLRLTESETGAYVTSFFDGYQGELLDNVDRLVIRSLKKVESYADVPGMNSSAVCDRLVTEIDNGKYDFIICALANTDVVGHTGDMDAAVKACEIIDECVGRVYDAAVKNDFVLFISSTHGKAEQIRFAAPGQSNATDEDNSEPFTGHTMNPVPVIMVNFDKGYGLRDIGCLADIAPTILETMGIRKPKEMTGKSLLIPINPGNYSENS